MGDTYRSTEPKRLFVLVVALFALLGIASPRPARCQEVDVPEEGAEQASPLQKFHGAWEEWPHSGDFKITLEYRNYTYFKENDEATSADSRNEGRLRVEYDRDVGSDMRLYLNALLQADDDGFTHGFFGDYDEDDLKRDYFNFTEAFLDIYFDDFDLRLGKQIITWGKADAVNPTNNINPSDLSNLLDDEDIGVVAVNLNYYWNDWNLQLVGIPFFAPSILPPQGSRFSFVPVDGLVEIDDPLLPFPILLPVENPQYPSNTIENSQFGIRLKTTYEGWDFSLSYYDGVNDVPAPTVRLVDSPIGPVPDAVVPVYHRYRAIGGDFATTYDRWGFHGEAAQIIFDGDLSEGSFQYVLGFDYTQSNILFDHDLFIIVEYVGKHVNRESESFFPGSPLNLILMSAVATNISYEFSEYTTLEIRGVVDFYGEEDYYVQPQLTHQVTDNFEVIVGFDILGGSSEKFFGSFKDNDRVYAKLKYSF